MIPLRHPSRRRLAAWLEDDRAESDDTAVDAHVQSCHRCANRLEDMAQPIDGFRAALADVLAPPADLHAALRLGIEARLRARAELELMADLLTLPWQTAKAMTPDEDHDVPD